MGWSGFFKGISATLIACALIGGGGFLAVQYLINQYSAPPPRPTFPNDSPSPKAKAPADKAPAPSPVAVKASPSPPPKPSPTPAGYRARITLSEGLNLRQQPDAASERVDGVDYNDEVVVLEESADKEWIKVRVSGTGAEGWLKSGYTERLN